MRAAFTSWLPHALHLMEKEAYCVSKRTAPAQHFPLPRHSPDPFMHFIFPLPLPNRNHLHFANEDTEACRS